MYMQLTPLCLLPNQENLLLDEDQVRKLEVCYYKMKNNQCFVFSCLLLPFYMYLVCIINGHQFLILAKICMVIFFIFLGGQIKFSFRGCNLQLTKNVSNWLGPDVRLAQFLSGFPPDLQGQLILVIYPTRQMAQSSLDNNRLHMHLDQENPWSLREFFSLFCFT